MIVDKKRLITTAGKIVILVIMVLLFNKLTNQAFFTQRNMTMLLKQGSVLMILTSSLMLLLIQTNIDLSGGAGVYLTGVVCALLIVRMNWHYVPAIIVAILLGMIMGGINGFFVGKIGLPAFIVTLAAQQIFRGTGYVLTDATTIGPMPKEFIMISEYSIPPLISALIVTVVVVLFLIENFVKYKKSGERFKNKEKMISDITRALLIGVLLIWVFLGYNGIPMAVVIASVTVFSTFIITNKTVFGRRSYLVGGNKEASRLAGVNINNVMLRTYLYEGLMYGIGGVVLTARLGGAAATGGNLLELDAVAAACIGGVSMSGGSGTIQGCVLGVIVLTAIDNVMSLMNISSYIQMVVKGIILLIAVSIDLYTNKSKLKFKLRKEA
ncbi:MAG: sugar ABC transporter permease [Saccharofermentanales bacterium]